MFRYGNYLPSFSGFMFRLTWLLRMGAPWDIRGNNASGKPPNIIAENLNYLYLEKEVGFLREDIYYPSEAPEERNAEWPPGNPNPDAMDDGQKTMRLRKPTPLTIKFWPQGTWDSYKTLERKSYSNSRFYLVCLSPLPNSPETDWIQAAVPVDSRGEINTDNLEWIPLASDPFINFTVNYAGHVPYNIRITQIISAVGKSANMNYAFIREGYHTTTKYSDATIQAEKRVWTKDRDYRYGEDPLGGHITVYFMNTATNPSSFYPAHVYVDNDITFNYKSVVWFFPTPGDPEKFGGEF